MSARLRDAERSPWARASRLALALAAGLAIGAFTAEARADDQTRAEELFDEGRQLMRSRATLDRACQKLDESVKLWDRGDTVLNLALCHRLQGKTATALEEFDRALTHGIKVRFPAAIVEAQKQRAELLAILSKLTVGVPKEAAALEGLSVEVNGSPWPRERWNTAFAMDPGRIQIQARAKGHKPFEVQVDLGANKDEKRVVIALEIEPPSPPPPQLPPPPPPPPPLAKPARPSWPWIVGGAGVALGAGALGAEIVSRKAYEELNTQCGKERQSCPLSYDFRPARARETIGYGLFVGFGAGAILALGAAGVGLVLPVRAPARAAKPTTSFVLSPTSIGVQSTF